MFEDKYYNKANYIYKNHIRHQYNKSTGFSKGYKSKLLRPTVQHNVTGQVHKHMMKGTPGYEQLRNKVMETAEAPIHHINQLTSGTKKSKINIGL